MKLLDRNVKIESDVSVSEQKKLARKLRKEQSKNEKESDKKVKDDDPDGLLLVDIPHSEMLAKSVLYLAPINEADPTCMLAWVYGADIYFRQGLFT